MLVYFLMLTLGWATGTAFAGVTENFEFFAEQCARLEQAIQQLQARSLPMGSTAAEESEFKSRALKSGEEQIATAQVANDFHRYQGFYWKYDRKPEKDKAKRSHLSYMKKFWGSESEAVGLATNWERFVGDLTLNDRGLENLLPVLGSRAEMLKVRFLMRRYARERDINPLTTQSLWKATREKLAYAMERAANFGDQDLHPMSASDVPRFLKAIERAKALIAKHGQKLPKGFKETLQIYIDDAEDLPQTVDKFPTEAFPDGIDFIHHVEHLRRYLFDAGLEDVP